MRHFTYTPSKKLAKDTSRTINEEERKGKEGSTISGIHGKKDPSSSIDTPTNSKSPDSRFKYVPKKMVEKEPEETINPTLEQFTVERATEECKHPLETMMSAADGNYNNVATRRRTTSGDYSQPVLTEPIGLDIAPVISIDTPKIARRLRIEIKWENVRVWPKATNGFCTGGNESERYILDNVSGAVRHGQFLSLMGSSGAGKTTLLQYLSNKMFPASLEASGNVIINKKPRETIDYERFTAFVQQDDILMEVMTIRECLEFAAEIKCPGTSERKRQRVNETLDELELRNVENLRVDDPMIGKYFYLLNTFYYRGDKKRASIGVELVANPSLLFMDEPTTGMDSATATRIVSIVRKLTERERTVIITIHQPSAEIFRKMDQLMILSLGKVVYFGHAHKATDFFASEGLVCPIHDNPLEYFLKIMSREIFLMDENGHQKEHEMDQKKAQKLLDDRVELFAQKEIATRMPMTYPFSEPTRLTVQNLSQYHYTPSWWSQFWILYKRSNMQHMRSLFRIILKVVATVAIILFGSILYYKVFCLSKLQKRCLGMDLRRCKAD